MTEPLKDKILKGDVHTIEEMKAWLQAFVYKVELLHPQLEVTKENIKYHHTSDI